MVRKYRYQVMVNQSECIMWLISCYIGSLPNIICNNCISNDVIYNFKNIIDVLNMLVKIFQVVKKNHIHINI